VDATGTALVVLFGGLALWLLVRRLSGAFTQPLSGLGIVAAGSALALAAHCARLVITSTKYSVLGTQYRLYIARATTLTALTAVASLSLPGTHAWGLVVAWLLVLGGEMTSWLPVVGPHLRRFLVQHRLAGNGEPAEAIAESEIPTGFVQQMTRVREENRESIHVLASAEIPAGDRLGVVHISFCPPLTKRPELTAHAMAADDVEVRLTQAEVFGARIEVRASQDQMEPRNVLIEVLGSVMARQSV
jgi:hypothetical protein